MGFQIQGNYTNAALGTSAINIPVPTRVTDRGGNGGGTQIRVSKSARIKNASPTNIVYVKRLRNNGVAVASSSDHELQINPGLEDDIELDNDTSFVSIVSSAANTPVDVSFGGLVF